MGSDLYTAGKTSARRRLLQEGQAVSESELIIVLLNGEVHFVQPSTGEFLSLLLSIASTPRVMRVFRVQSSGRVILLVLNP
jgi:hypothetical protein